MTYTKRGEERRLERLDRLLAGRREQLASALMWRDQQPVRVGSVDRLSRHGYSAALLLVAVAVFPTAISFAWRHRALLFNALRNGLAMNKVRNQFEHLSKRDS